MREDFAPMPSAGYFDALFSKSCINTVIIMDLTGKILAVNNSFTNWFGYSFSDIIGQNFSVLFTDADRADGMPDEELAKVINTGQANDKNYLVKKNRELVWVSGETILVKNEDESCIIKVIQDIHAQKESENSLAQVHDLNESILTSIADAVIVLDENMRVLKANRVFTQLTADTGIVGSVTDFASFTAPYDKDGTLHEKIYKVIHIGTGFTNKYLTLPYNGGERVFELSCSLLPRDPGKHAVLLTMHDITAQKQSEREREDIIGFVAHELRNPLANVVLCNEMMSYMIKENNTEEMFSLLERSKNNILRLNKMISELYDVTKVNSGNFNVEFTDFDFDEMIKEAIDTVQGLQPSYNIIVEGEVNAKVRGDRYRLIQVVTNYLSNGIKYSNGHTDVIIEVQKGNDTVTVAVKDKGLGISREQLPYIFQRFFRAERTKNLEGIGLGLYLCRRIIDSHQGKVWAESEEGKGSTFYFSIPARILAQ